MQEMIQINIPLDHKKGSVNGHEYVWFIETCYLLIDYEPYVRTIALPDNPIEAIKLVVEEDDIKKAVLQHVKDLEATSKTMSRLVTFSFNFGEG